MGEAKRRRAAAPFGGLRSVFDFSGDSKEVASPSTQSKRGLVVSPPVEVFGNTLRAKSPNLDPQELRCAVFLWDQIVWPSSRAIHFTGGPDEQFLEKEGFLSRPEYTVNGDVAQGYVQSQIMAFNDLDRREPGVWSLSQGENSLLLKGGQLIEAGNAQLRLHRAIPVPNFDVPFAEVLEFKIRRKDEILAMRQEIDNLLIFLNDSDGYEETLKKQVSNIDRACADAIRVGREWQFPVRLTNFKVTYKIRPLATVAGAITGVLGSKAVELAASYDLLAGMVGAAIATAPALELSFDGFEWRGLRPRQGPYRYVCEFHKEFF